MATPLASILAQPLTQFCDANGVPYAEGFVYTYVPATLTPKNTWIDAGEVVLNTNPIVLDSAGRCIMYGSGQYRILLKDSLGNTVYDQLSQDLLGVLGSAAYLNIGANLENDGSGNLVSKITTSQNIVAASTTDLGSKTTDVLTVTGNTTITSFGSSANIANPLYFLTFSGTPLLTYNAISLILPSAANIQAAAGDTAIAQYLGSGNWKIVSYTPASGLSIKNKSFSIVSQTFAANGTYTPTAGMAYCQAFVTGGGGGGGGAANGSGPATGGGGGAGATGITIFSAATIGGSQAVTVGAAGAAGISSGGNGGNGGTSSLGTLLSANGGAGGAWATNFNANGGVGATTTSGATISIAGGDGVLGSVVKQPDAISIYPAGGASYYGGGGGAIPPAPGVAYGSGGGGTSQINASSPGGAGAGGFVQILEYILS